VVAQTTPGASATAKIVHPAARAADESLAVATSRATLTTAAILSLGLLMTLRLGRSTPQHPEESSA
jgi:hypothetical protein